MEEEDEREGGRVRAGEVEEECCLQAASSANGRGRKKNVGGVNYDINYYSDAGRKKRMQHSHVSDTTELQLKRQQWKKSIKNIKSCTFSVCVALSMQNILTTH